MAILDSFIQLLPVTALTAMSSGLLEQKKWRCLIVSGSSEKKDKTYFYIPDIQNLL